MSAKILAEIRQTAIDAAVDICWRQWTALGSGALGQNRKLSTIVDPEALILLSLDVYPHERRLSDLMSGWVQDASSYLSVQRVTTLAKEFPELVQSRLRHFAAEAHAAGDRRWKRLAEGAPTLPSRGKDGFTPRLTEAPALMVRLRAGFGVGVKADLLTVLLGCRGESVPVRRLLDATGYTEPPLRDAASDLTLARFIHETSTRPVSYYVEPERWMALLQVAGVSSPHSDTDGATLREQGDDPTGARPPAWRYWSQLFALLATVVNETERLEEESASPYLASTRFRDVYEAHVLALELNRIRVPTPAEFQGAEYLEPFSASIETIASWMSRSA